VVNVPGWLFVYGYETNAGDVFPGIPEKGFIFPHCFQEDFDVDGVSDMFLPRSSVQGYGRLEFSYTTRCTLR